MRSGGRQRFYACRLFDYRLAEEVVAITYNFDDYSCYALGGNFDNNFFEKVLHVKSL